MAVEKMEKQKMDVTSPIGIGIMVAAATIAMREAIWIYRTSIKRDGLPAYQDGGKSYHSRRMVEDAIVQIPKALSELNQNLALSNERLIQLSKDQDKMHQSIVVHLSEIKGKVER